ncbi:hypothetical protein ATE49_08335 [Elizabethkingia miricola]|uniref:DUF6146 family protein n=1 Tax=Elizabethkingia miricola TaxID=172045 RepID=A0ABD5B7L6_ELIMR|nr:DUF6146 family protein [Elizabethkingia miricola]MDQ8749068.1 DUF6146 family protein [Elizabethkingia miricola]NHQ65488.1 hypothetical protein [Elizabethkingia miricola]NHQ69179.1 hypothetical protein [Elizabethkingia miricola]NHQ76317.1 hypothetical protein [Elizabethkingia miricola]OBS11650.1 hypothetical protein ATE49_08335 [Elizabethkingia miricola]
MKNFIFIIILSVLTFSCTSRNMTPPTEGSHQPAKVEKGDDGEWELTVFDTDYENFLLTRARPKSMYTESYLKSRNTILVNEWNSLYMSGRYRNIVESQIDYDPNEKYGMDFEYRLYQVFVYVNWKYGLKLYSLSNVEGLR